MSYTAGEAQGMYDHKVASPEYPSILNKQPPVKFGEQTGFQAIITSSWVLRWAAMPTTYAAYRQIRKHPTIALARILCAAPVLAAEWSVKAKDGADPEWVRLIQDTFMPLRERFLEPALLYGNIDFGYMGFEKVFEQVDGYDKITKLKPLLQDITEICIGHRGEFLGFRQWGTEIGLANAIHVGFRVEGSYLYGIPLLENVRPIYNDWMECNEGAKRYDRHVAGAHWVIQYPDVMVVHNGVQKSAAQVAQEVLWTLESAGGVAIPRDVAAWMQQLGTDNPGWIVELQSTGTQEQAGFVDRLNYLDKQMCRGLLLPDRSVLEGTHGTKEEAQTHLDAAMVTKDLEHRYCTAELQRQAVNEMLVLNFGPKAKDQVELEASPIVDSKRELFKDLYKQVLDNPQAALAEFAKMDMDAMRDALGIPKAKETDKPNEFEQMAEQNRQQKQQMMNGQNGDGQQKSPQQEAKEKPTTPQP